MGGWSGVVCVVCWLGVFLVHALVLCGVVYGRAVELTRSGADERACMLCGLS